jgi:hypothetical protein
MIPLKGKQLLGVYLLLKEKEPEEGPLSDLMVTIEKYLYDRLSIDEMEKVEELYKKKIDVLSSRG